MGITTDFRTAVKRKFQELLYGNKKFTLIELAETVGKSASLLSRMAAEHEDMNLDFALIRDLMKKTKNYGLLELLAQDCGKILIDSPKLTAHKGESLDLVADLQANVSETVNAVNTYFKGQPTNETYEHATKCLSNTVKKSASARIYIEKHYNGQYELNI